MKRILSLIGIFCIVSIVFGQGQKLLTMEDAILNRDLNPKNYLVRWSENYPNQYLQQGNSLAR